MEYDLNASYKEIFGNRMLGVVKSHIFLPEEIYSEKGNTVDDCYLEKVVLYDIVWQARTSAALSSIDDAQCYDSIVLIKLHSWSSKPLEFSLKKLGQF